MNIKPDLDAFFTTFGLPATVTPVGGDPITTTIIWEPTTPGSTNVGSGNLGPQAVLDARPKLSLRRDEVPDLTKGARIECAGLAGGTIRVWTVGRVTQLDDEVMTVDVS